MRFPSTEAGDYTQQVGMTLAEIAYAIPDNISRQLAYPYYAGKGVYRLQWLGVTAGNQMYVCRAPSTDQWIIVIRGSTTDPWQEAFWIDWFEQDLTTLHQEPLPFVSAYNGGSMISWGTLQGFEDLIGMTDVHTGLTLVEYLQKNATFGPGSIAVIGHSLGGALASVLTPYLYETLGRPKNISPIASCRSPLRRPPPAMSTSPATSRICSAAIRSVSRTVRTSFPMRGTWRGWTGFWQVSTLRQSSTTSFMDWSIRPGGCSTKATISTSSREAPSSIRGVFRDTIGGSKRQATNTPARPTSACTGHRA
jgi:hypothetical protein